MLLEQYLEREALAAAIEKAQLLDQELIAAESKCKGFEVRLGLAYEREATAEARATFRSAPVLRWPVPPLVQSRF